MSETRREQSATETRESAGRIIESAEESKFSRLWSRVKVFCVIISTVFAAGVWLTKQKHDLDWKAHLAEDKEVQVKVAQEREESQRRLRDAEAAKEAAEAEAEKWKGLYEQSKARGEAIYLPHEVYPARPPKEPAVIIMLPKSN